MWLNPQFSSCAAAQAWGQRTPRPLGMNLLFPRSVEVNSPLIPQPIRVWNTHFGHREHEKDQTCQLLPTIIRHVARNELEPQVVMADCNFFSTQNGPFQRLLLTTAHPECPLDDLSFAARPVLPIYRHYDTTQPFGTFVGSSCDAFKPDLGCVGDCLDIIAGRHLRVTEQAAFVWNKTLLGSEEEEATFQANADVYPSDHTPIVIDAAWGAPRLLAYSHLLRSHLHRGGSSR